MRNELRQILTAVLGTTVFMFLAMSAIAVLSSGKIFDDAIEPIGGSADAIEPIGGSANESVLQELPQPIGPTNAPKGEALAAVTT